MGRIVVACYKPKTGKAQALRELMRMHHPILKSQGLVTNRESILMESEDGTIVEVFEWASMDAIEAAHQNPVVAEMWDQYSRVCDYVPIASVPEANQIFSQFSPVVI